MRHKMGIWGLGTITVLFALAGTAFLPGHLSADESMAPIASQEQVHLITTGEGNPRNSEGAFIALKNGDILHIYTHFYGGAGDEDSACLASRRSCDGGRTWTETDKTALENEGKLNTMSVSLLRLTDGNIALFYLVKEEEEDCIPYMRLSSDEGETWGERIRCIDEKSFNVVNNDRVIQLKDGTILMPVACHSVNDEPFKNDAVIYCRYSTNNGRTWQSSGIVEHSDLVLQEPGLVELADGSVLLYCRSSRPVQILSRSTDGGRTWSKIEESCFDSAILAPALIKRIPNSENLLAVWDPQINGGARTNVDMAVLTPDAKQVLKRQRLDLPNSPSGYQYPQILFTDDEHFLVGFFDWSVGLYVFQMTMNPDAE